MDLAALIERFLDIAATSEHVMKRFTQRASEKRVTLRFLGPEQQCSTWGDLKFTREILDNLNSNALKFSPLGKEVRVRLEHTGGMYAFPLRTRGLASRTRITHVSSGASQGSVLSLREARKLRAWASPS